MALNQHRFVHDLIEGVKRKKRKDTDACPPASSTNLTTNRGHKLERDARYVHQGNLNNPNGIQTYKRSIDYNGYRRNIISLNPPLIDDDGDIVEDEDDAEDGDLSPMEDNAYQDIRLEELLRPLTSAAELPIHPSLSQPYKDKGLQEMIRIAEETLHREQEVLWRMKDFFTQFRGDATWAPVGEFHTSYDDFLAGDGTLTGDGASARASLAGRTSTNGSIGDPQKTVELVDALETTRVTAQPSDSVPHLSDQEVAAGVQSAKVDGQDWATQPQETNNGAGEGKRRADVSSTNGEPASSVTADSQRTVNGIAPDEDDTMAEPPTVDAANAPGNDEEIEGDDVESQPQSHRMTTRAQAQRSPSPTRASSSASSIPPIHPIYQFPISAVPDPYSGLPPNEASATTACLLQYVSKQEEVVRGTRELYNGLLRAMRMRKEVLKWAKADGHVGEMSDGEDWYDKEEWGLEQDLTKGREEDEDEAATAPGKKTRRRAARE